MWCSRGCLGPPASSDACLWHVSLVGGARRRGCAAAGVSVIFNRLLGLDVAQLADRHNVYTTSTQLGEHLLEDVHDPRPRGAPFMEDDDRSGPDPAQHVPS